MNYNLKLQAYKISQIAVDTKLIKDGKEELAIECFVSPKFPLNGDDDTLLLAHCLDEIQDIAFEHINRIFEAMNFTGLKIEASE